MPLFLLMTSCFTIENNVPVNNLPFFFCLRQKTSCKIINLQKSISKIMRNRRICSNIQLNMNNNETNRIAVVNIYCP